ncbi:MAG TPA: methyltransferase domain-containing protein [Acidothermaceae bacterium]|jgi:SAM-dependent methyltransferase
MSEHGDTTLASYEAAAALYRAHSSPSDAMTAFLDRVVVTVGVGQHVLELGSGHGWDAAYLESHGLLVTRTDGAIAFVEMMRADGYIAHLLDIRRDDFGGPYDAVLADAVLLHLSRAEFADAIARAHDAVAAGGVLAVTLKVGDGEAWSTAKLGLPRFFTYWREPAVRVLLEAAGWIVDSIDDVDGNTEPWLYVLAHA